MTNFGVPATACDSCVRSDWEKFQKERWESAGFEDPRLTLWIANELYSETQKEARRFTHQLGLQAILLRDSDWNIDFIRRTFQLATPVLAQCGIQITAVHITEVTPKQFSSNKMNFSRADRLEWAAKSIPLFVRGPLIIYTDTLLDMDHETGSITGFSGVALIANEGSRFSRNTAWLSVFASELSGIDKRSTLAHELGHILLNGYHDESGLPNLMAAGRSGLQSVELTADQCEKMRNSPLIKPIGDR
jgi:hypothetical protein